MAKYYKSYEPQTGISLGKEFEGELIEKISYTFKEEDCFSTEQQDLFDGTDIFIYGIPCDFTYNFAGKDHMEILPEGLELAPGIEVRFGVRTGNSHNGYTQFKTPVLVIGFEGVDDEIIRNWMEKIVDRFVGKIHDIIEVGQSQYWDWVDAQE